MANSFGEVFVLKTSDRSTGVPKLLSKIGLDDYSDKQVALKANFNSADPFPASIHIDTFRPRISFFLMSEERSKKRMSFVECLYIINNSTERLRSNRCLFSKKLL